MKTIIFEGLTAHQWQLYTCSMKCGGAARRLNAGVRRCAKKAKTREEFVRLMREVQMKVAEYGAADSEPNYVVERLADRFFGEEW